MIRRATNLAYQAKTQTHVTFTKGIIKGTTHLVMIFIMVDRGNHSMIIVNVINFCSSSKISFIQIDFCLLTHPTDGQNDHQIDYGRLKNVDKSLYLASPKAEQCPLCHRYYKRMVSHFRRVHSKYEVFVSRVSQNMANSLMQTQSPAAVKYAKASGMQYLKMMCPFCEIEKDFFAPYWTNHMRTHTGEYTNKCIDCGVVSLNANHCGRPTSKQKCHLYEMGLTGYICIRCNYVQIDKKRIISHLKTQHDNDRIAIVSIENEFREVVIIPPLRAIHAQANPNGEPNQGIFFLHLSIFY